MGRSDHEQRAMNLSRWILIGRKFVILESRSLLGCTRGPWDRESTVHVRCPSPARGFKTRRARFNVGRRIQDQRPTFADSARARARARVFPWTCAVRCKIGGSESSTSLLVLVFPERIVFELKKVLIFRNAYLFHFNSFSVDSNFVNSVVNSTLI